MSRDNSLVIWRCVCGSLAFGLMEGGDIKCLNCYESVDGAEWSGDGDNGEFIELPEAGRLEPE